jgi:hypothetical protein
MGISVSLLLAAAGAVLIWAVNASVSGLNIHTIGVILLVAGVIGFVTSLFFWSSWGGFGNRCSRDRYRTMIWLLVLLLLVLAIGGGLLVSKFLFIVLVVALVLALVGTRTTA